MRYLPREQAPISEQLWSLIPRISLPEAVCVLERGARRGR